MWNLFASTYSSRCYLADLVHCQFLASLMQSNKSSESQLGKGLSWNSIQIVAILIPAVLHFTHTDQSESGPTKGDWNKARMRSCMSEETYVPHNSIRTTKARDLPDCVHKYGAHLGTNFQYNSSALVPFRACANTRPYLDSNIRAFTNTFRDHSETSERLRSYCSEHGRLSTIQTSYIWDVMPRMKEYS